VTVPSWAGGLVRGRLPAGAVPCPPDVRGDAAGLALHQKSRYRAAAHHARRVYPEALGELVARELQDAAEFGYGPGNEGLAARLAAQVLALPARTGR
jgi:hypothetical protein